VYVNKGEAGTRSPVPQQSILDVLGLQRFIEQRIIAKINHPQAEIIAGSPVEFGVAQFVGTERLVFDCGSGGSVWAKFENFGWTADFDRAHNVTPSE
jgi:hypothetical protein